MHESAFLCFNNHMNEIKPEMFADFCAIGRRALDLVNDGNRVADALEKACREIYPYTYKSIEPKTKQLFYSLMEEKQWGELRTLRALAEEEEFIDRYVKKRGKLLGEKQHIIEESAFPEVRANYHQVFQAAWKKAAAGFDPLDALEMACFDLYPYTAKKVYRVALSYLRLLERSERIKGRRALKYLSENPDFFDKPNRGG